MALILTGIPVPNTFKYSAVVAFATKVLHVVSIWKGTCVTFLTDLEASYKRKVKINNTLR